ncbi:MAG: radical SAM protein [candidate division Zixibacteria bacterium]|nr:radical SAM protein [candidate division Zixibacteria bacterium]
MSKYRTPRYLRVSLLSACNLQCSYCLPPGIKRPTVIAPDDKLRTAIRFLHDSGINKIRFTGGEPTLYKDLPELVSFVKSLDQDVHTAITSNGVHLKTMAKDLALAGLDSVNISLDTLDPDKFKALAGKDYLKRVISGVDAAIAHIGNVKLNSVLIKGVNDDETEKLISFAESRELDIRFIEFMPNRYSPLGDPRFISSEEIRGRLPWDFQALPTDSNSAGRYYIAPSLKARIGFISSVSHPFCESCDRIRLAANGLLYTCLYESSNIDIFKLLAADSNRAQNEYKKLLQSKQFSGCHGAGKSGESLPSFSAIGG